VNVAIAATDVRVREERVRAIQVAAGLARGDGMRRIAVHLAAADALVRGAAAPDRARIALDLLAGIDEAIRASRKRRATLEHLLLAAGTPENNAPIRQGHCLRAMALHALGQEVEARAALEEAEAGGGPARLVLETRRALGR